MKFERLPVAGAYRIHLAAQPDHRGFFARSWCVDTFREQGIHFDIVQANLSHTLARGTIRGMHYQRDPYPDAKVVRCCQGRIFEVIADVRPGSATYGRWYSTVLEADTLDAVYVPAGCAQGFQSLTDDVIVEYFMSERYHPELYDGFRYDDILVGIKWPVPVSAISAQDLSWPALGRARIQTHSESRLGVAARAALPGLSQFENPHTAVDSHSGSAAAGRLTMA